MPGSLCRSICTNSISEQRALAVPAGVIGSRLTKCLGESTARIVRATCWPSALIAPPAAGCAAGDWGRRCRRSSSSNAIALRNLRIRFTSPHMQCFNPSKPLPDVRKQAAASHRNVVCCGAWGMPHACEEFAWATPELPPWSSRLVVSLKLKPPACTRPAANVIDGSGCRTMRACDHVKCACAG